MLVDLKEAPGARNPHKYCDVHVYIKNLSIVLLVYIGRHVITPPPPIQMDFLDPTLIHVCLSACACAREYLKAAPGARNPRKYCDVYKKPLHRSISLHWSPYYYPPPPSPNGFSRSDTDPCLSVCVRASVYLCMSVFVL